MPKKKVIKKATKPSKKKTSPVKPAKKAKPVGKKAPAKKLVVKKSAPKKVAAKKPIIKKAPAKKLVVKKSAPKKVTAKKPIIKKAPAKKLVVKKPAANKPIIKKSVAGVKSIINKLLHKKSAKQPEIKKAAPKEIIQKKEIKKEEVKIAAPIKKAEEIKPEINVINPVVAEKKKARRRGKVKTEEKKSEPRVITKPIITFQRMVIKNVAKQQPAIQKTVVDPNKTRYSDEELAEFKELITKKLDSSKSELKYLQEQVSRSSELGGDDDARFKGLEDGTMHSEREYLSQMASRQIQYISHLEKALMRIENKTYGICRETGKLISKERLKAVPHATLSIEAKQSGKG
ncbi:MAG: TraR/DksA C4-type zinc finger protein [Fimbriimonadaceae bacterium]|nr:TraR/DksA C4-type zinc finger protein [Chitinophagales bacterium]